MSALYRVVQLLVEERRVLLANLERGGRELGVGCHLEVVSLEVVCLMLRGTVVFCFDLCVFIYPPR